MNNPDCKNDSVLKYSYANRLNNVRKREREIMRNLLLGGEIMLINFECDWFIAVSLVRHTGVTSKSKNPLRNSRNP